MTRCWQRGPRHGPPEPHNAYVGTGSMLNSSTICGRSCALRRLIEATRIYMLRDPVWIRVQAELFVALRGTAESGRKTLIIMHCCNSTSIGIIPPLFVVKRLSALLETHRKYMPLHCITTHYAEG